MHQFNFLDNVFLKIMNKIGSSQCFMSPSYLGFISGSKHNKTFKQIDDKLINKPATIKKRIYDGFAKLNGTTKYVSFFVFCQHNPTGTARDNQLNLHVCVYTIRSANNVRDAEYFDPSAEVFGHAIPKFLRDMRDPKVELLTRTYGAASRLDDCLFQCMKHVIELHTDCISF